jgi:hypothetical protein
LLRDVEPLGGAGEAAFIRYRECIAKMSQFHVPRTAISK